MKGLTEAYRALCDVYIREAFVSEAVKKPCFAEHKAALRLVYGTIEHHYLYDYRLSRLVPKAPKTAVSVLLKMGMYLIDFADNVPTFAAVNEIVETAKAVGKGNLAGFINAVLRRYTEEGKELYPTDETELLSVRSNRPLWLVKRYIKECGKERAMAILSAKGSEKTHIRSALSFGKEALRTYLAEHNVAHEETPYGFTVGAVSEMGELLQQGKATVMSEGSLAVAEAVPYHGGKILDMCAAPGGKSVYLAEKFGAEVIACELYPHRAELIKQYAERMHAPSVVVRVMDGTCYESSFAGAFGTVLLDAPCSGLGTVAANPDIVLHRKESDLAAIIQTQKALLQNAARYVTEKGSLVYATCSDLPSEDEKVTEEFLKTHPDFTLRQEMHTETESMGEGYYFAVLEKK